MAYFTDTYMHHRTLISYGWNQSCYLLETRNDHAKYQLPLKFSKMASWLFSWMLWNIFWSDQVPVRPTDGISIKFSIPSKFWSVLVWNMLNWPRQNFAHVPKVTLSWCVQNFVVIGRACFKPEHCTFWSNFIFGRNVSGTVAWSAMQEMILLLKNCY